MNSDQESPKGGGGEGRRIGGYDEAWTKKSGDQWWPWAQLDNCVNSLQGR